VIGMNLKIILLSEPVIRKKLVLLSGIGVHGETISCECACSEEEAVRIIDHPRREILVLGLQRIEGVESRVVFTPNISSTSRIEGGIRFEMNLREIQDKKGTTLPLPKEYFDF
jgi:hypothetical protein